MAYVMEEDFTNMICALFVMAVFFVEGANLVVPCRENSNFKCLISWFSSFFKGFIGAGWLTGIVMRRHRASIFKVRGAWKGNMVFGG